MATPVSGVNDWLTLNNVPLCFQEGEENIQANALENMTYTFYLTTHAPQPPVGTPDPIRLFIDQEELETSFYGRWAWKPESYAGLYDLRLSIAGYPDQETKIRVFPQKMNQAQYTQMQDDLSQITAELLFCLKSPVSEYAESSRRAQDTSPLHDYQQVCAIFDQLQDIFAHISRNPHHLLTREAQEQPWYEMSDFDEESQAIEGDGLRIQRPHSDRRRTLYMPATWRVQQATLTHDVYENRLLKYFIHKQLTNKLTSIQDHARAEIKLREQKLIYKKRNNFDDAPEEEAEIAALNNVIQHCQDMKQRCLRWCSELFLQNISENIIEKKATQVFLKHPQYSRFYQIYLQFQQQLKLSLDTHHFLAQLNMRKVADLYEMWGVFQITRMIIRELQHHDYRMISSTLFFEIEKNYFQFTVKKNTPSIILTKNDIRVEIKYEPIYRNRSTTLQAGLVTTIGGDLPQTPDMTIEVYQRGKPTHVIIFDPKYSRYQARDGHNYPQERSIEKMNRYKNSIKYQQYNPHLRSFQTQKIVSAAYALYPGDQIYAEEDGQIGGLPIAPGMPADLSQKVNQHLCQLLADAELL